MRIGIDISQVVYEGTGVGKYIRELMPRIIQSAPQHHFILFAGTLRQKKRILTFVHSIQKIASNVEVVIVPLPPTVLDFLWNTLHMLPIEWFIGKIDVFWSSDWTQPPLNHALGVTTIHDVSFLHFPETFHASILTTQKRRLAQVKKECSFILADSEATKKDIVRFLHIPQEKISVVYPGFSSTV